MRTYDKPICKGKHDLIKKWEDVVVQEMVLLGELFVH